MTFIGKIKNEILEQKNQKNKVQQYVSDVFLTAANGSIKNGYQVDFLFDDIVSARAFSDMLAAYDILPKLTTRGDNFVVYIKSKECVCNLLALIGANKSLMELSNEIALRELRNTANRRANCDTHNIGRQVGTASEQFIFFSFSAGSKDAGSSGHALDRPNSVGSSPIALRTVS